MEQLQMSYQVQGEKQRRTLLWEPLDGFRSLSDFAQKVMAIVRPGVDYDAFNMQKVLRKNGITDLRRTY